MTDEQSFPDNIWTPSTFIDRLGQEISSHPNCEDSVYYW
eukprot:CAMPEP_0171481380 /NCGR_PEP_ID=MMETSP0946-20130122/6704_1 /TAXON_ID=109269 /ORGANISM="Vaucheria litorea, Strain CCMP2940" /LENGTH=38 /DNA_ID= /DNA_START= /DNA_END= /DNA_ORIENTATION=